MFVISLVGEAGVEPAMVFYRTSAFTYWSPRPLGCILL